MVMILTTALVNAWTDKDRLNLTDPLDASLEGQIASQVIGKASQAFDTSTWITTETTPTLIKSVMAMLYAGCTYQSKYIDTISEVDHYGTKLIADAWTLLDDIISGKVLLTIGEVPIPLLIGTISFEPLESDPKFTMDKEF